MTQAAPPPQRRRPEWRETIPEYLAWLWQKPWLRLLVYLLLTYLVLRAAQQLLGVLIILGVAYGLSYMFSPLLLWLEKRGMRRGLSVALILILFLVGVGVMFWMTASQISSFIAGIPALLDRLPRMLEKWLSEHQNLPGVAQTQGRLVEYIREKVDNISNDIGPITASLLSPNSDVMGRVMGALGWLGQATFVITLAVFFMLDHARPGRMLLSLLPRQWQSTASRLADDVSESFGTYIRGQLATGIAISLIAVVGLLFLKIPNALALALLTGISALIPMFGMILATIPVLLQAIPVGTTAIIGVCIWYFIINQVAFNVIQPMIMGRTSSLSPAGILVAVMVGGSLAGLGGAFLAIPAAMLLQRWVTRYWLNSPAHEGRRPAPPAVVVPPVAEPPRYEVAEPGNTHH